MDLVVGALSRLTGSKNSDARDALVTAHRLFGAIVIAAVIVLSGCDRNASRAAAVSYLENLHQANYARCYAMLSDRERKDRTLAEFLTEIPLAPDVGPAWFRPVLRSVQFDLGE